MTNTPPACASPSKGGDDLALASLLKPDARMVVDTGDDSGSEVRGRGRVAAALRALLARHPDATLEAAHVNGGPALALRRPGAEVIGVLGIEVEAGARAGVTGGPTGAITRLWLSTSPRKLSHWNRGTPPAG